MKILLLFGNNLFRYQKQILSELSLLDDLEIYAICNNYSAKIPKDSKFIKLINERFPVIKVNPHLFESTAQFIAASKSIKRYEENLIYDYVINFCNLSVFNDLQVKYACVIKLDIDIKNWYSASINKSDYTTINILKSSDNQNFSPFKSMSFTTQIGIYNNRDKAFYYFSYLIKSVFNGNRYPDKGAIKTDYNFFKRINHHIDHLKIIYLRKFSNVHFNWKLAILKNNEPVVITDEINAFWADPFIINHSDNNWIFFEELDHKKKLGKISLINLKENKPFKKEVVLEKPYHLSFPNVFEIGDQYFMMPEESASNNQNIYKAEKFPTQWEHYRTILKNKKVVDPVFILHNQKYWLFFNEIENFEYDNNERLNLYYSDDLFSDHWVSHPQNPIIIDKAKARNAGKIMKENEEYIRVAQDCKDGYGQNISKNRITELSEKIYTEEKLPTTWDFEKYNGFHTINVDGDITVIDLLVKE
ncbi:glucosamine inositolphosphorylceramide transferase family protein [Kaistella polysaccharea]|uniref:glucosamine inositolphosphorylceramide transferase family protein n=1 Tax=Kaistella polysaccharea TaxID=2878534 RepID=UPI001CF580BE|nr:hypothetical protein [Kaistella polysaccharea]